MLTQAGSMTRARMLSGRNSWQCRLRVKQFPSYTLHHPCPNASASVSPEASDEWPNPLVTDVPATTSPEETMSSRGKRYATVTLASGMLLVADKGIHAAMTSLNIQFPHTLAGMIFICVTLTLAKAANGAPARAADAIVEFLQPLLAWLARWMPVFFVPALISLPMSLGAAGAQGSDFVKIAQVIAVGWSASMLLVTVALKVIRGALHTELTPQEEEVTAPKPVNQFTPAHYKAWSFISVATLAMCAVAPSSASLFGGLFLLASTVTGYLLGVALPAPLKAVFHPILICSMYGTLCVHLFSRVTGMGYHDVLTAYMSKGAGIPGAGAALMGMLTVVVLCDGVRIFLQRSVVRRHALEIFGTVGVISLFSLFFTAYIAAAVQLSPEFSRSLLPRSITVALALPMTQALGGIQSLTTAVVCATGLIGAALGQMLLGSLRMRDEISRGVAQGSCSHGLGASAMAATEPQALPFCAVTIAIMGTVSNILLCVPYIRTALVAITG